MSYFSLTNLFQEQYTMGEKYALMAWNRLEWTAMGQNDLKWNGMGWNGK